MSWVAEAKPVIQKSAIVPASQWGVPRARAPAAHVTVITSSMASTKKRFVRNISTTGDQRGLMTQGRYMEPVYSAISALERPRFLYITADMTVTAVMGVPMAK
jgi:hypothetical protein